MQASHIRARHIVLANKRQGFLALTIGAQQQHQGTTRIIARGHGANGSQAGYPVAQIQIGETHPQRFDKGCKTRVVVAQGKAFDNGKGILVTPVAG